MGQLSIALSDELSAYVARRVAEGPYETASDFVDALLRRDREGQPLTEDELRARLLRAKQVGPANGRCPKFSQRQDDAPTPAA